MGWFIVSSLFSMSAIRVVMVALLIVLTYPQHLAGSDSLDDKRLFFRPEQRDMKNQLIKAPLSGSGTGQIVPGKKGSTKNSATEINSEHAQLKTLTFNGLLRADTATTLWINGMLWTKERLIPGVKRLIWDSDSRRLFVTLDSGIEYYLRPGEIIVLPDSHSQVKTSGYRSDAH